jgi:hypothetical protein
MSEMNNQGAAEVAAEETVTTKAPVVEAGAQSVEQPATVEGTPVEEPSTPTETEAIA